MSRRKNLGNLGERWTIALLQHAGFQSVQDLNALKYNHPGGDFLAERNGIPTHRAQCRAILLLSMSMMLCDPPWHSLMLNSVDGASILTKKRERPSPAGSDHQMICAPSEMATEYLPSDRLVTTGRLLSTAVGLRRFIRPHHRW
jgi:hypothetical protein